ncbi:MAG: M81 family peptidase, partial [Caldilineae bacterium]
MTKLFIASLGTETNTFSPFVTSYQDFADTYLVHRGQHGPDPFIFAVPLLTWRRLAEERGWDVTESLCAFAMPSGVTLRRVYEQLRDEILDDLRAAMPVDAVLLSLHGAMVIEGYDLPPEEQGDVDCADGEGDLLAAVRRIVGPDVPIGAELDLHCHITRKMVENADVLITFKEYPHTDFAERAEELFAIIADQLAGRVKPVMSLHDCRLIGVFHTTREPMRSFVDDMQRLEQQEGVLSVSLGHGFPWGDVADMGTRALVVTDNRPEEGARLAADLCQRINAIKEEAQPNYLTIDEALDEALALAADDALGSGPVVLADVSDNAGGGAPNDSTFILRRVLERGIGGVAFANFWDPVVVQLAMNAGVGARFALRLGGKMGPMSGDPVDVTATVIGVARDAVQTVGKPPKTAKSRMGDAVGLRLDAAPGGAGSVEVEVNSHRTQSFNPDALTQVGIDPLEKSIVVVKSMQHFYAGYGPIARAVRYVAAPG